LPFKVTHVNGTAHSATRVYESQEAAGGRLGIRSGWLKIVLFAGVKTNDANIAGEQTGCR